MTESAALPTHAVCGRFRLAGAPLRGSSQALAAQWRGAVASIFADDPAFHGHDGARVVARYPEVHYRWSDGAPSLFAIGRAAERVMAHPWPGVVARLGEDDRRIVQVEWSAGVVARAFSRRLIRYEFGAPWVALNQENHARARGLDLAGRREQLDRILVGNLLTMSQAFGWYYSPEETVYAAFECARDVPAVVKGVSLRGFEGTFVTNLELPDGLAIGRSVSHGFGWFRRITSHGGPSGR